MLEQGQALVPAARLVPSSLEQEVLEQVMNRLLLARPAAFLLLESVLFEVRKDLREARFLQVLPRLT